MVIDPVLALVAIHIVAALAWLVTAFRKAGWFAIAVLTLSGIGIVHAQGFLAPHILADAAFWASAYGQALLWKTALVGVMATVTATSGLIARPLAARARTRTVA